MLRLKLQQVDFSGNSFSSVEEPQGPAPAMVFKMGSLVEIAGSAVLNHKLHYSRSVIPFTLVEYLNASNYCGACGLATLDMGVNHRKVKVNIRDLFPLVTLDYSVDPVINFDCYCCSFKCSKILTRRWMWIYLYRLLVVIQNLLGAISFTVKLYNKVYKKSVHFKMKSSRDRKNNYVSLYYHIRLFYLGEWQFNIKQIWKLNQSLVSFKDKTLARFYINFISPETVMQLWHWFYYILYI